MQLNDKWIQYFKEQRVGLITIVDLTLMNGLVIKGLSLFNGKELPGVPISSDLIKEIKICEKKGE